MRRLLQFGTILLLMTAFGVPVLEWFDRWDSPGLFSDSEYRVFALVLVVCLVLFQKNQILSGKTNKGGTAKRGSQASPSFEPTLEPNQFNPGL